MVESSVENGGKLVLKDPSKRQEYLDLLDRLIETAFTKAQSKYCKNSERISWIRAIANLVSVAADVLKDSDLDDIEKRLSLLEQNKAEVKEENKIE
jgi:hypothetical protein